MTSVSQGKCVIGLSVKEKLKVCWGVLFPKELFSCHDKKDYIFNMGYRAGKHSTKSGGTYEVVTNSFKLQESFRYSFDDLQAAIDFIERFYDSSTDIGDSCDFVQTYLDRDMSFILPTR